jgi:hypothetical protein
VSRRVSIQSPCDVIAECRFEPEPKSAGESSRGVLSGPIAETVAGVAAIE